MKRILFSVMTLMIALSAVSALAATADATVVAAKSVKVTAPYAGTLLPFDLEAGDSVEMGAALFEMDTAPVYAARGGVVSAMYAHEGEDASGVAAHYGALAYIEPEHPFCLKASTHHAHSSGETKYVHEGEMIYLKDGSHKGTGLITEVSGKYYTVEILTGSEFDLGDTVRCYRESNHCAESEIGRGEVTRYDDYAVRADGRVTAIHVKKGDRVKVGDLLFETVNAQAPVDASPVISAPIAGPVKALYAASGSQVYRGQLLCEITDLKSLVLSAEIDEIDLSGVATGMSLSFTLDAYAGETFTGTVTEIRPLGIEKQNATYYDVRITLPSGKTFLPGMSGTVRLD